MPDTKNLKQRIRDGQVVVALRVSIDIERDRLEDALGKKAERILEPMQLGDVKETYADLTAIQRDLGFQPTTSIQEGIPKFVAWYRDYHKI